MTRREWLITLAGAAAASALGGAGCAAPARTTSGHAGGEFYGPGAKFNEAAAKKACLAFMASKGYPVAKGLRENLWVTDFGLGVFPEIGMAVMIWANDKDQGYYAADVFLLPGQAVPEHQHVKSGELKPKLEVWHVRSGLLHVFGEGESTPGAESRVPPSQKGQLGALRERTLKAGEAASLGKAEEKHWMRAGPDGAIVSEYGSWHDPRALRFTNPRVKF